MQNKEFPSFRIIVRIFLYAVTPLMLTFCISSHSKPRLFLPYDTVVISENNREKIRDFSCQPVPESVKDMIYYSIYTSKKEGYSIVDPVAEKKYKKATKKLTSYENAIIKMSNLYLVSQPRQEKIALCVLDWLDSWALNGALLGKTNRTGKFVRKWTLGTLASAYAQIMEGKDLDPAKTKKIENWLRELAFSVLLDFDVDVKRASRQNNHLYWATWAVANAGIVLQDKKLFDWAMIKTRFALSQVRDDGTLPLEMARMSKAFHYHLFATGPLVMLAETAKRNGIDLYGAENGALHRLVKRVLSGLDDVSYFKKLTGKKQNLNGTVTANKLAWVEVYHRRFPSKRTKKWLEKFRPVHHRRLGGNLTLLFGTDAK